MTLADLTACCGSSAWARAMFDRQPFSNAAAMHAAADEIWWSLKADDWLDAFSKHPKIGQKSAAKWAQQEQSGMSDAAVTTALKIDELNAAYEDKFGFIFIVCATGKSASEMLDLLQTRMNHTRDQEVQIAATEQAKITRLRLEKLVRE